MVTLVSVLAAVIASPPGGTTAAKGLFLPTLLHRSSSDVLSTLTNCQPVEAAPLRVACRAFIGSREVRATFAFDPAQVVQTIVVDHQAAASREAALAQVQPWIASIERHYGAPAHHREPSGDQVVFARSNLVAVVSTKRGPDGAWLVSSHLSDPSRRPRVIKTL